jgi:sporulation protein YlmC with PRC-barrel domain
MIDPQDNVFSIRDILDSQLLTSDGKRIGRVADIAAEEYPDGSLRLTHLLLGPQALAGRINSHVRVIFHFFLRDRFEHSIPISEITRFGPTLILRGRAKDYRAGGSERWIAKHILRWIPGNGQ